VPDRPAGRGDKTLEVTVTISDVPGRTVPTVANVVGVETPDTLLYDPRTQALTVDAPRAASGFTYTLTMAAPPGAAELKQAPQPPAALREFLVAPQTPAAVDALLAKAPEENLFDRLQFVRDSLYANVVAAGVGQPVDLPAERVADLLAGGEGTPYEITAAEVLLARWAGVPARIGYGYYGGDKVEGQQNTWSVRPVHGAMWLEAYFEGYGWVPIIGTPPKAKASLSDDEKRTDSSVRPTDEIALIVYVPIKLPTFRLLFEYVRFWAVRVLPAGLAIVLLLAGYPGLLKVLRRARRRRWARARGPAERLAVAYAEMRDLANDYNFGDPMHTPLEFVDDLHPDDEHRELAWLVTRGIWGDLSRDLQPRDAELAEDMSDSVMRRLRRANGGLPRVVAFASRASLRDPYTAEIPNLWWPRWRAAPHRVDGRKKGARARRLLPTGAAALAIITMLSGCSQHVDLTSTGAASLPNPIVPGQLDGYVFTPEPELEKAYARPDSLVAAGRVFTIHEGPNVQGSLQVGSFKAGLRGSEDEVREGVVSTLGTGRMQLVRIGADRVYVGQTPDQHFLLWLPPSGSYYQLLALRKAFTNGPQLMSSILAAQHGSSHGARTRLVPPVDVRRSLDLEGRVK
jgi:hypothetical protein